MSLSAGTRVNDLCSLFSERVLGQTHLIFMFGDAAENKE